MNADAEADVATQTSWDIQKPHSGLKLWISELGKPVFKSQLCLLPFMGPWLSPFPWLCQFPHLGKEYCIRMERDEACRGQHRCQFTSCSPRLLCHQSYLFPYPLPIIQTHYEGICWMHHHLGSSAWLIIPGICWVSMSLEHGGTLRGISKMCIMKICTKNFMCILCIVFRPHADLRIFTSTLTWTLPWSLVSASVLFPYPCLEFFIPG